MFHRALPVVVGGLLALGMAFAAPSTAKANDPNRFYHYPFYYFPHNYYPNHVKWPDPRQQFQPYPAYMAYPPYRDPGFRYDLYESKRFYRGHHFFLDQF